MKVKELGVYFIDNEDIIMLYYSYTDGFLIQSHNFLFPISATLLINMLDDERLVRIGDL